MQCRPSYDSSVRKPSPHPKEAGAIYMHNFAPGPNTTVMALFGGWRLLAMQKASVAFSACLWTGWAASFVGFLSTAGHQLWLLHHGASIMEAPSPECALKAY